MASKLNNERGVTLLVVLMIMVIMLSVVGAGLLFSGVSTKITANYQTGTKAFYAADAGVSTAVTQLTLDTNTATAAFSRNMGSGLAYRSGRRNDSTPQPLQFLRTRVPAGYSLGSGTGSNAAGYVFYDYQVNVTGTYTSAGGTELAGREIEAIATYGPVPR
jgi:Tfp pilus assembly protein PilX